MEISNEGERAPSNLTDMTSEPTWQSIGNQLRVVRKRKGLTLKEVERTSKGKWKAVVIGSYERSQRALTLAKAIELAAFYRVPLHELLGITPITENQGQVSSGEGEVGIGKITLDLRKVSSSHSWLGTNGEMLSLFTAWICASRQDWNGEILTIRASDLSTLALMSNRTTTDTRIWLQKNKLLYG